ncbi:MAG: MarR family transcriptional regulator [Desulfuromonadaceae bacterium]|nr:MarR family transcriptional regulator [Desulfuromonadaceae bacterium]
MQSFIAEEVDKKTASDLQCSLRGKLIGEMFDWLHGLSNVIDEQSREIEKWTGLSKNQALTVRAVMNSPSASVSELAKIMYLNPATMVRILDRLEEQEFITRTRSKEDRRVVKIGVTERGRDIELTLRTITRDSLMHCLESTDDHELMDMLKPLQKLSVLFNAAYLHPSQLQNPESLKGK